MSGRFGAGVALPAGWQPCPPPARPAAQGERLRHGKGPRWPLARSLGMAPGATRSRGKEQGQPEQAGTAPRSCRAATPGAPHAGGLNLLTEPGLAWRWRRGDSHGGCAHGTAQARRSLSPHAAVPGVCAPTSGVSTRERSSGPALNPPREWVALISPSSLCCRLLKALCAHAGRDPGCSQGSLCLLPPSLSRSCLGMEFLTSPERCFPGLTPSQPGAAPV